MRWAIRSAERPSWRLFDPERKVWQMIGAWPGGGTYAPGLTWTDGVHRFAIQRTDAFKSFLYTTRLGTEFQLSDRWSMSLSAGICQLDPSYQSSNPELIDFANGVSGKFEYRFSSSASVRAGREPAAQALNCNRQISGRAFVPTPSQWGLSLFKSWRF